MRLFSRIKSIGKVTFPQFRAAMLYMHEFDLAKPDLPEGYEDFNELFTTMLAHSGLKEGRAHVTIDCRSVLKGKTHRLSGPHVDGNYNNLWGGGGWLLQHDKNKMLSPEDHKKFYCSPLGGMLIAANEVGCQTWTGAFKFLPGAGGDCSQFKSVINKMKTFILKANICYKTNSTCIHESIPLQKDVKRMIMRITLPPIKVL